MVCSTCGSPMNGSMACETCGLTPEHTTVLAQVDEAPVLGKMLANLVSGSGLSLGEIGALVVCFIFLKWQCLVHVDPEQPLGLDDLAYLAQIPYHVLKANVVALEAQGLVRVVPATNDVPEHVLLIPRMAA